MTFSKLGTDIDTQQMVYLPKASRTKGVYILGLQGSGKSGLIENLCVEDGKQGTGFCVIDPHGELIDNVISRLPAHREQDVILFDIRDYQFPFGLNLFTCSDPTNPLVVQEVVDQVMHVFEMLVDVNPTTPQILDYLRNCTNVLVANPGYTMADVTLLLRNRTCREKLLQHVTDSSVLSFWHDYFDQLPIKEQLAESISLERRVRHFLQALTLNIVGQSKTSIDFRFVMDEGKILLVKLDSLRLPSVTKLIGALTVALFLNAAPSRTKKNLFNIYADEFPLYATEDFVTLIEQARKRQIGLAMAHQNRGQLDARTSNVASKLRDRTLGTKQKIIFTITGQDANEVAGEFDVSPQAAWEEEIAKEWVEVLKPEWYERVEEEVIDGEEEIKTPVKDVFNHLLNGGAHKNYVVNQFALGTLQQLQELNRNQPAWVRIEEIFTTLNQACYRAMVYRDIYINPPLKALVEAAQCLYRPPDIRMIADCMLPVAVDRDTKWATVYPYLLQLWNDPTNGMNAQNAIAWLQQLYNKYLYDKDVERMKHGKDPDYVKNYQAQFYPFFTYIWEFRDVLIALATEPLRENSGLMQPHKRKQINYHTHPAQTLTHPRKTIMHPQRPYQDVKNDIANQLSGLPNYTARVKLDDTFPQNPGKKCLSCKLLNNPGAKYCAGCGKQLPAPNEYTIETIRPTGYIGTQPLAQRIKGIQARNRQKLYCRSKQDVEAETTKRQTGCSGGSAPAQPQKPQQQAQHARQVPTCPNCGKNNSPGAKFCNQCGSPI